MTLMTRVVELRAMQYRRTFRASIFSSFLNPVLFLLAMGVGLGTYVDRSGTATLALGGLSYLQFLAPGLLAATAMQAGAFESTFPVMGGLSWQKTFHAMYATPVSARDIVVGNLTWIAIRLTTIAAIFTIALFRFGIPPLFLFSGTFFPISNLPDVIEPVAWLSPLWHGVELSRQLALGTIAVDPVRAIAHVAILVTIVVVGTVFAYRTVESRLVRG